MYSKSLKKFLVWFAVIFTMSCSSGQNRSGSLKSVNTPSDKAEQIPGAVPITVEATPQGYAQASINLDNLPAGNGFSPKLSLVYSSAQKTGSLAGLGWDLAGINSIGRCPKHKKFEGVFGAVALDDSDSLCLNGKKLLLVSGENLKDGAVYRGYLEEFKRITFQNGSFELKTRNGEVWYFGRNAASREKSENGVDLTWFLDRSQDRSGNFIDYEYIEDGRRLYLSSVSYGGNAFFSKPAYRFLRFTYDTSPTAVQTFVAGQSITNQKFLKSIDAASMSKTIWSYNLRYEGAGPSGAIVLTSIEQCFADSKCFPKTVLGYEGRDIPTLRESPTYALKEFAPLSNPSWAPEKSARSFSDINNDGWTDLIAIRKDAIAFSLGSSVGMSPAIEKKWNPTFVWDPRFDMVSLNDIDRDGYLDIAVFSQDSQKGGVYVAYWKESSYTDFQKWTDKFGSKWSVREHFRVIADVNGDGWSDLVGIRDDGVYLMLNQSGVLVGGDKPVLNDLGLNKGWIREQHPRYFVDVNGDGLLDILGLGKKNVQVALGKGDGFDSPKVWLEGFGFDRYYNSENLPRVTADMNGDGLVDLVGFNLDGVYVALNSGKHFQPESRWLDALYYSKGWAGQNTKRLIADINKDGFPDFVGLRSSGIQVYYGRGAPIVGSQPTTYTAISKLIQAWNPASDELQFEDLDNDGQMEFVVNLRQGTWNSKILSNPPRLVSTRDGTGSSIGISYDYLTREDLYSRSRDFKFPLINADGALPVVREVQRSNGAGGTSKISYQYENAAFHTDGFGFLGFEKRKILDQAAGNLTVETYNLDAERLTHGTLSSVEVFKASNPLKIVSRVETTPTQKCFDDHPMHCAIAESDSVSTFFDEAGNVSYIVSVRKSFDDFLNAIHVETKIVDKFGEYITNVDSQFSVNTTAWDISLLEKVKTTQKSKPAGVPSSNAGKPVVRTVAFSYDSDGRLFSETIEPDSEHWIKTIYSRSRNTYGLVDTTLTSWSGSQARGLGFTEVSNRLDYDDFGFAVGTINELGQLSSQTSDPDTGLVTSTTDINGLVTNYGYDLALRPNFVRGPDGTVTHIERMLCNESCPPLAVFSERTSSPGFGESVKYLDSKGRSIRTVKSLIGTKSVSQDFVYDERGLLTKVSKEYFAGETPKLWTNYSYDERNRKTLVTFPDGASYGTIYEGLQVTLVDPLNRETIQTMDSSGRIRTVKNAKSEILTYEYDAAGRLVSITDPAGNKTEFDYDLYGRRTFYKDPTTGTVISSYNALGKPYLEVRGGIVNEYTYDALGRMIRKVVARDGQSSLVETWSYDEAKHGVGRLSSATGPDSSVTYAYDDLSRPTEAIQNLLGKTYVSRTSYDNLGRVSQIVYPGGFSVSYTYDEVSQLKEIRDSGSSKSLWSLEEVYPNGNVKTSRLGNGARITRIENEISDRIESEIATGSDQTLQMARTYEYDLAGNLMRRSDATTGVNEAFSYDALNRVESFRGEAGKTVRMIYDSLGRITERSDLGTYEYGKGCDGGLDSPFALKKLGSKTFCTDELGNFVKSGDRILSFNSNNLPLEIKDGKSTVRYQYGLNNKMLSKEEITPDGIYKTLYVGDSFEIELSPAGEKRKHYIGDFLVIESDGASNRETYLYKDFLGSTLAAADHSGVVEKLDYDPYGQRRGVADLKWMDGFRPRTTSRGFTDHDHADSVNLIHMKGRMYDPTIGLFLSPDPYIQDPTQVQNFNPYAYVLNNPFSYTDPSGFLFEGIGRGLRRAFSSIRRAYDNVGQGITNTLFKGVNWLSSGKNQRLVASIAISVAGTMLSGPGYLAITGAPQMAAYSAAVGYTSAYVASNGNKKAALNGAITGAAFSLVGSAFDVRQGEALSSAQVAGKIAAHAAVGGASAVMNGGKFESGFWSAGLSQAAGQSGIYESLGAVENAQGWQVAHNAAVAAVVGGSVSEVTGGSFEQGALTAALGRLLNDIQHLGEEPGLEDGTPIIGKAIDWLGKKIEHNLFGAGACVSLGDTGTSFCPVMVSGSIKTVQGLAINANSATQGANLAKHLSYIQKYGAGGITELENGVIRYYGELQLASKPGEMAGRRYVHEFNPAKGTSRGWHETLDHSGRVRQVRPELNNGIKKHYRFDENGNFSGSW